MTTPTYIQLPPNEGVNKFGRNPEVDSGATADVWDFGGTGNTLLYPWPSAAAATTVVSDDTNDTAAGTGARTVEVQGLDANYVQVTQTATLDGTTPVALTTNLLRVFRAKVLTAGSGETNAGNIDVKHTTTVLARVTAGYGQTLMALYTVPADRDLYLAEWHGNGLFSGNGTITFRLDVRPFGGAWNCKETHDLGGSAGAGFERRFSAWQNKIEAKSDIRIRVFAGSDNNVEISAGFDLVWPNPIAHLE